MVSPLKTHIEDPNIVYFVISKSLENYLEKITVDLHQMFVNATEHVINTPTLWDSFCFPAEFWEFAK